MSNILLIGVQILWLESSRSKAFGFEQERLCFADRLLASFQAHHSLSSIDHSTAYLHTMVCVWYLTHTSSALTLLLKALFGIVVDYDNHVDLTCLSIFYSLLNQLFPTYIAIFPHQIRQYVQQPQTDGKSKILDALMICLLSSSLSWVIPLLWFQWLDKYVRCLFVHYYWACKFQCLLCGMDFHAS